MRARVGIILVALLVVVIPGPMAAAAGMEPFEQVTTTPSTTAPTSTVAPTTTVAPSSTVPTTTTTRPTTTTSTTQPTTTTSTTQPSTTTSTPQVTTTTTTAGSGSSGTSGTTIGLIVAAVVAVLLIIGVLLLLLRRRARLQWREQARGAGDEASSLLGVLTAGLAAMHEPTTAARTWSDLESRGVHLHGRLQALAAEATDQRDRAAVARLDQSLQSLRAAVEADRSLRMGPPPPTPEQLGYSEAVIRQRAADFEQSLRDLELHLAEPL